MMYMYLPRDKHLWAYYFSFLSNSNKLFPSDLRIAHFDVGEPLRGIPDLNFGSGERRSLHKSLSQQTGSGTRLNQLSTPVLSTLFVGSPQWRHTWWKLRCTIYRLPRIHLTLVCPTFPHAMMTNRNLICIHLLSFWWKRWVPSMGIVVRADVGYTLGQRVTRKRYEHQVLWSRHSLKFSWTAMRWKDKMAWMTRNDSSILRHLRFRLR